LPGIVNHTILIPSYIYSNITSGFESAGIFPLDPYKFEFHDFVASFVTDHPIEEESEEALPSLALAPSGLQDIYSPQEGSNSPDLVNASFSPEDKHPCPKAGF
jgi:hypothetical protein